MSRRSHRRWCDASGRVLVMIDCRQSVLSVVFVYILANESRQLYIGVTNHIERRMYEHVTGWCTFTSRYRITPLVYVETVGTPIAAIRREKRIKAMLQSKKVRLIQSQNPAWDDLAEGWFDEVDE